MPIFSEPITAMAGVAVLVLSLPRRRHLPTWRLTIAVILLAIWAFAVPMRTIKYFLVLTALLWIIESSFSRQPLWLWGVIGVVISPLFHYLSEVFSFPIRLQISEWAGWVLSHIGYAVRVSGNVITLNEANFNVDAACMGLHLLGFSYLAAVFLLGQAAKSTGRFLSVFWIIALLVLVFGLNVVANLVRIIVLVIGGWPADHPLHELAGLLCVLVYVWFPLAVAVRFLNRSQARNLSEAASPYTGNKRKALSLSHCLLYSLTVGAVAFICLKKNRNILPSYPAASVKGYEQTLLPEGIKQLKNAHSLIYLKTIPTFYSIEHSPYICWQGSGYAFSSIREMETEGVRMYKAKMTMGPHCLYTAWWFSDGTMQTNSQLTFRWQALWEKKHFYLVNVTVNREEDLDRAIEQMLNTDVSSI
ncbi:MAG: exosortase N [Spirosomataceae bacterium]